MFFHKTYPHQVKGARLPILRRINQLLGRLDQKAIARAPELTDFELTHRRGNGRFTIAISFAPFGRQHV